jgi:hypothetical protein
MYEAHTVRVVHALCLCTALQLTQREELQKTLAQARSDNIRWRKVHMIKTAALVCVRAKRLSLPRNMRSAADAAASSSLGSSNGTSSAASGNNSNAAATAGARGLPPSGRGGASSVTRLQMVPPRLQTSRSQQQASPSNQGGSSSSSQQSPSHQQISVGGGFSGSISDIQKPWGGSESVTGLSRLVQALTLEGLEPSPAHDESFEGLSQPRDPLSSSVFKSNR